MIMEKPKKKAFIFDIDGTLADNSHRQPWVQSKPKNWAAYNKAMDKDTLISPVAKVLDLLSEGESYSYDIIICTGREATYRDVTRAWLSKHGIWPDYMYMRKEKDYSDDSVVKSQMLDDILKTHDVIAVFDDRTKVVDMWRSRGLFVFDCNQTRSNF